MTFWEVLKKWFAELFAPVAAKPVPAPETPAKPAPTGVPTRAQFNTFVFDRFNTYWRGESETHGQNRSPKIDAMIKRQNGQLGEPYCAYGIQDLDDDACKHFGIRSELPDTGGTQYGYNYVLKNFPDAIRKSPAPGYILCMVNRDDPDKGHWAIATSTADAAGSFTTKEFNTNHSGSRDGGNIMDSSRNLAGDSDKRVRGFIDWYSLMRAKS
jgi:hypothetical protein